MSAPPLGLRPSPTPVDSRGRRSGRVLGVVVLSIAVAVVLVFVVRHHKDETAERTTTRGHRAPGGDAAAQIRAAAARSAAARETAAPSDDMRSWERMVSSELLVDGLRKPHGDLKRSVMNLVLPDQRAALQFAGMVTVVDLAAGETPALEEEEALPRPARRVWPVEAEPRRVAREELRLWEPLFREVAYFDNASFKIPAGRFLNEQETRFELELDFHGLAHLKSGQLADVHASQLVEMRRVVPTGGKAKGKAGEAAAPADPTEGWFISSWKVRHFETHEADAFLFDEVLGDVLRDDPATLARARASEFDELMTKLIRGGTFLDAYKEISGGGDTHPAVAVVDLDRDGFDDFYFVPGWGRNLFFRNRGDGTFEEIAEDIGLAFENDCAAALFADFDNDGDADCFLGRSYERSLYLVNEAGPGELARFVDRTEERVGTELPYLVSSLAAADYDGDGLLDLFLATNGSGALVGEMLSPDLKLAPDLFLGRYLPEEDARELNRRIGAADYNRVLNHAGPPNLLLHNTGDGRFEVEQRTSPMSERRSFRNTFQGVWADYDDDGDPDLYVANDWAVNELYRNDGEGRFVDVAPETGTTDIGFGMGASWGDFDRDEKLDLYVSNMYSKAGRRVLTAFSEVDERLRNTYRGNTLFRQAEQGFEKVSGTDAPALLVEKAGWSWGGQFFDADNDGWLDLYALSGNFTAPPGVAADADI